MLVLPLSLLILVLLCLTVLFQSPRISPHEQIQAYNDALSNMASYMPYGDVQSVLNEQAEYRT